MGFLLILGSILGVVAASYGCRWLALCEVLPWIWYCMGHGQALVAGFPSDGMVVDVVQYGPSLVFPSILSDDEFFHCSTTSGAARLALPMRGMATELGMSSYRMSSLPPLFSQVRWRYVLCG